MAFVGTMVVLFTVAIAAPVNGQAVHITSELDAAGRNFSCTDEFVTYICGGLGETLTVNSPPLLTEHVFFSRDSVPAAAPILSNVVLTLTNLSVTNSSSMFNFAANLQIRVLSDTQPINVSCSTNDTNKVSLPLIHESKTIEPPSTVTFSGDTIVSWTPPLNPQFDIDYYIVRIYVDGALYTTRSSRDNGLDVTLPSGEITADVRTVSTCGSISAAQQSVGSVSGGCANGSVSVAAGFLIPTLIGVFIIIIIVIIIIVIIIVVCKRAKRFS